MKAYDLGLVKQIEVDSVMEENAFNDAFISLDSIQATKTKVTAKVTINSNEKDGVKKKSFAVKVGDDLYKLCNEQEVYSDGYIIEEIDAVNQCISLSNGNLLYKGDKLESYGGYSWKIPDVLSYIQSKTELTRSTIEQIITQSNRINDIIVNPQLFLDLSVQAINRVLHGLIIDGIKYQKIGSTEYKISLFEAQELEIYLNDFSYKVKDTSKTIYEEYIPLDSGVESRFAQDCESSEQVKFYFKLPNWFKIPTPIGNYYPYWALVFEGNEKV